MTQTDPNNYDLSYISSSLSAIPDAQFIEYNFEIQPELCGKLIGVSGHFINSVKRQSGTKVLVKYPYGDSQMNICSIYGTCVCACVCVLFHFSPTFSNLLPLPFLCRQKIKCYDRIGFDT